MKMVGTRETREEELEDDLEEGKDFSRGQVLLNQELRTLGMVTLPSLMSH